jgi:hypothetical protein
MTNYSTSPIAAFTGGGNNPPPINPGFIPGNDPMYIRDILSGMINQRVTDFTSEQGKNALSGLAYRVGRPMAIRLMTEALNFNTRPDMQGAPVEKRIQSFYDMGSRDPGVDNIIHRASNATTGGVLDGFRNTPLVTNAKGAAIAPPPASRSYMPSFINPNPASVQQLAGALKKKTDPLTQ